MTTQLIAILASAGLLAAGVAATTETRSSSVMPAASLVTVSKSRAAPGILVARQIGAIDCALRENKKLDECKDKDPGGYAKGGNGSGVAIGVGAAAAVGAGVYFATKNDSNG